MRASSVTVVATIVLLTASASEAAVVASHVGSNDPSLEGWTAPAIPGGVSVGPVSDGGVDAWFVDDNSLALGSHAVYESGLTFQTVADGKCRGWVLRARLRAVDVPDVPDGSIDVIYRDGSTSWQLQVGTTTSGDPIAYLRTNFGTPQTGTSFTVAAAAGAYVLYELVFDPSTQTADLFVDGTEVISNYAGYALVQPSRVLFGSGTSDDTGHANYALVEFVVNDAPPAGPGVIASHAGASDPSSEGWAILTIGTGVMVGPIVDGGTEAWFVDDNSLVLGSHGIYERPVASQVVADGNTRGWILRTRLRVVDVPDVPDGSIDVIYRDGSRSWQLQVGTNGSGDPIALLRTNTGVPNTGPTATITGAAGTYVLYELVYDPTTQTADLFVNGSERISNYAGFSLSQASRVLFGSGTSNDTGHANYALVEFLIRDDAAPTLSVPPDVVASAGPGPEPCSELTLVVDYGTATATDNCGTPSITVAGVPAGDLFAVGETILTWTATDAFGNATTGTQSVVVECPVGQISGVATLTCDGASAPAEGVTVRLLHEGQPFIELLTDALGAYGFTNVRHGTYTVAIVAPPGFAVSPDARLVTLTGDEANVDPFLFSCLLSDLTGRVTGTCDEQTVGLQGVTVDVFDDDGGSSDVLLVTTATDETGAFRFDDLALGEYNVGIVLPLGYSTATLSHAISLTTPDGELAVPEFGLACQVIAAQPRSMGYWKHQVNVYLTGKGHAQESLTDLIHFIDELVQHFNQNLLNPVVVYVPGATSTNDKLLQLKQLLTVNRGGTMLDQAKQQLLALMLNVVSGKISQTEGISEDGATVSQAITHVHDLIVDGDSGNDEVAKDICDLINNGKTLPAGLVPIETRVITYRLRPETGDVAFGLHRVYPNPAAGDVTIRLGLSRPERADLQLLDIAGRVVWRHTFAEPGRHVVRLEPRTRLAPGAYLLRLRQGPDVAARMLIIMR